MLTVSAIIPVCDGRAFIGDALDAVLGQTRPPEEIIVVDDGSTDGTAAWVEERYRGAGDHPRVRVVRQANQGVAAARNLGAAEARGDYLALCDADDVWLPRKLETQLSVIERLVREGGDPPPALGSSRLPLVPDGRMERAVARAWKGRATPRPLPGSALRPGRRSRPARPAHPTQKIRGLRPLTVAEVLMGCDVMPSSVMIRRDVFDALGGFDPALRRGSEDFDFWLRLAIGGRFLCLPEPVFLYRVRAGSVSSDPDGVAAAQTALLRKWSPVAAPEVVDAALYRRACTKQALYVAYRYGLAGRTPPASFLSDFLAEFPTAGPLASVAGFGLWLARRYPRFLVGASRIYGWVKGRGRA